MSKEPEGKPVSPSPGPTETPQLGRRLFVFRTAAVLGGAATAAMIAGSEEAAAKDFGSGHQDPEGSYHVYDAANRGGRYRPDYEESEGDNDPDDD